MSTHESNKTQPVQERLTHIDFLRGLAALLVVWLHSSEQFAKALPQQGKIDGYLCQLAETISAGRLGVVIFFAISGFVIAGSLRADKPTRNFIIDRFFRLFPVYWLSIPVSLIVFWWGFGRQASVATLLANLTMLPTLGGYERILDAYWTLESELAFYLICCILMLTRQVNNPLLIFLLSSTSFIFFVTYGEENILPSLGGGFPLLPLHLSIMLWGAMARFHWNDRSRTVNIGKWEVPVSVMFISLTLLLLSHPVARFSVMHTHKYYHDDLLSRGLAYILAMGAFLTLVFACPIQNRWMQYIGRISYSVYLFHTFVLYSIVWLLTNLTFGFLQHVPLTVYVAVVGLLTIGVSSVTYNQVELRFIKYGKSFTRRLGSGSGAGTSGVNPLVAENKML